VLETVDRAWVPQRSRAILPGAHCSVERRGSYPPTKHATWGDMVPDAFAHRRPEHGWDIRLAATWWHSQEALRTKRTIDPAVDAAGSEEERGGLDWRCLVGGSRSLARSSLCCSGLAGGAPWSRSSSMPTNWL